MSLVHAILAELLGMFVADVRLSAAALAVVGLAAAVSELASEETMAAGIVLLVGCPSVLIAAAWLSARQIASQRRRGSDASRPKSET